MKTEKRESVEDYLCSFPEKQRDLLNSAANADQKNDASN